MDGPCAMGTNGYWQTGTSIIDHTLPPPRRRSRSRETPAEPRWTERKRKAAAIFPKSIFQPVTRNDATSAGVPLQFSFYGHQLDVTSQWAIAGRSAIAIVFAAIISDMDRFSTMHGNRFKRRESKACFLRCGSLKSNEVTFFSPPPFVFNPFNLCLIIKSRRIGLVWGAFDNAKNHKRQRHKRQSVTAKREKSQTPKFV